MGAGGGYTVRINMEQCKYIACTWVVAGVREAHLLLPPVRSVARQLQWQATTNDFDILWIDTSVGTEKLAQLKHHQRVNHFPNMLALCRKADCYRNLERMAERFPQHYNFVPRTYVIPARLPNLLAELRRKQAAGTPATFIIKPSTGAQVWQR